MIYKALIEGGVVTNVIVVDPESAPDIPGFWVEYNESDDVGIGHTYTEVDGFRPHKPFPSWIWNGSYWDSPVPLPDQDNIYEWDEANLQWVMIYMKVV